MNRVNIVLATYNGEKYISEQIDSILNNSFKNWKLWIFDDGSTDKTSSIIEEYRYQYSDKIMVHHNEKNKGVTLNFLEGAHYIANYKDKPSDMFLNMTVKEKKEATMDYYMFCDQDDVWMPHKIEKTLKHMKKMEYKYGGDSAVAVFTDAVVVDDKLNKLYPSFYKVSKLDIKKIDLPHIMMENKMIGCTVMFNDQLLKRMRICPTNARYHDWWIAMIAASFGHISYLPEATLFYRQHSNNVVGNQSFFSYVKNRVTSLQKQKEVLHKTILQADEFYLLYHKELSEKEKKQVYILAHLEKENWIMRRFLIVRYGFLKTGLLRNVGLLWLV